jgi:hypothetical protein
VRLEERGPDKEGSLTGGGRVATGTKEDGLFREMWVYSSLSGGSGALCVRINGNESWNGRRSDVKRKDDDADDLGSPCGETDVCRLKLVSYAAGVRDTVESMTGGGDELPGTLWYALTASRICSSAAGRSWKYAKKYESMEYCSLLSIALISMVSLKSMADDFSTSTIAE